MISFFNDQIDFTLKEKMLLKSWIKSIILKCNKKCSDINVIFCSDQKILEINKQFLGHDYFTDIITFNYCSEDKISGELYISVDTVKENSKEYGEPFDRELHRVIIHGILHLLDFNDLSKEEKLIMREQENFALDLLESIKKRKD